MLCWPDRFPRQLLQSIAGHCGEIDQRLRRVQNEQFSEGARWTATDQRTNTLALSNIRRVSASAKLRITS